METVKFTNQKGEKRQLKPEPRLKHKNHKFAPVSDSLEDQQHFFDAMKEDKSYTIFGEDVYTNEPDQDV